MRHHMAHPIRTTILLVLLGLCSHLQADDESSVLVAASEQPAVTADSGSRAIIQLDVWMITLSAQTTADQVEAASAALVDRDEVVHRIQRLRQAELIARECYFRGTTVENEVLMVRIGRREPRVQNVAVTPKGATQSIVFEDVGTILEARAKCGDHAQVFTELQLESSYLEDSDVAIFVPSEGTPEYTDRTRSNVFHGTVPCPSGGASVAVAGEADQESGRSATLVFVSAAIRD